MQSDSNYFFEHFDELCEKYDGDIILIKDQKVIGHAKTEKELRENIIRDYGSFVNSGFICKASIDAWQDSHLSLISNKYKNMWNELKEKLDNAEKELQVIRRGNVQDKPEYNRLTNKIEGVKLAQQYIYDIEREYE